jgi:hypothetical protein
VDKNEFYKQLMTQYTFDSEKIRKNARRSSFALRNTMWLPLTTAAAVFITVFGGYMLLNNTEQGEPIPTTAYAAGLSPEERVEAMKDAEVLFNSGRYNASNKKMYLTFEDPMTFRQLKFALSNVSDTGNISVTRVWYSGKDESVAVDDAFDKNNDALYCGAEITTPMSLYQDINQCGYFIAAEVEGEINADNFTPFTPPTQTNPPIVPVSQPQETKQTESPQTAEATTAQSTPSALPAAAETTGAKTEETTADPSTESQTQASADETPQATNPAETDVTNDPANSDNIPEDGTGELPEITEAPEVAEQPEQTDPTEPSTTVDLPEVKSLELPIQGMIDARFVGKNDMLALTSNSVLLYKVDMSAAEPFYQIAAYAVTDPKITYIGDDGATAVIIGGDSVGSKNSLYIAKAGSLAKVDLRGQITADSVIRYALFEGNFGLINVSNLDISTLYVADIVDTRVVFSGASLPVSPDAAVLSFNEDGFIYAEGNVLYEYAYHTRQSQVIDRDFGTNAVFCRAKDFKNFSVSAGNSTVVYNAATGRFTPTFDAQTLQFSNTDSAYFTDGTHYYHFVGNEIEIITSDEYYNLNPSEFEQYKIETISQTGVTITEG